MIWGQPDSFPNGWLRIIQTLKRQHFGLFFPFLETKRSKTQKSVDYALSLANSPSREPMTYTRKSVSSEPLRWRRAGVCRFSHNSLRITKSVKRVDVGPIVFSSALNHFYDFLSGRDHVFGLLLSQLTCISQRFHVMDEGIEYVYRCLLLTVRQGVLGCIQL